MKRTALVALMLLSLGGAIVFTSPNALAARAKSSPSPSPLPSALPTATPEPPEVAIPRLQAKLKANPNDQDTMGQLAYEFININRPDLAVQLTQRLLQLGSKSAQVFTMDGYAQSALGNTAVAIADLEQASNLDPTDLGVLNELTSLYLRANRPTDAERIAKRGVTFNANDPGAYNSLGSVYAAELKFDDARTQYEKAFALAPTDPQSLVQIAQTYAQQNNIPMALDSVKRALAIAPTSVPILVLKGDLYAHQLDDKDASAAYDDATVAATTDDAKVAIMARKAAYFANEKNTTQAEAVFAQMLAQFPKSAAADVAFGDYWASQKNNDKAQSAWQTALSLDPDSVDALQRLSGLDLDKRDLPDAIGYLKRLIALQPTAQAYAGLGEAYTAMHDYPDSRDACTKSFGIQRDPHTLGCIAGDDYELKNYKEAAEIFDVFDKNKLLDRQPDFLYMAAKSYQQTDQRAKALSAYRRVLPMIKKGTSSYNEVQAAIRLLSRPPAPVHRK